MISSNQVIESVLSEAPFAHPARILWISREADIATLFTICVPYKAPWSMRLSDIESLLRAEKVRIVTMRAPAFMLQSDAELGEAAVKKRTICWGLVGPLLQGRESNDLYIPGKFGSIVAAYAKGVGKAEKSIFRWLYRYWAYGMTPNALLGNYLNAGAPGVERKFSAGKKAGRPPKYLGEIRDDLTKSLTDQDKSIIRLGYALYKENKVKRISHAYVKTLNHFYRAELPAPDGSAGSSPLKRLAEVPSLAQFSYWGKKAFDDMDVKRGRKGETKWAMDHRPIAGNAYHGLRGPCHRFEIDATIADIYLVSRFNRNWIIGRPVVYVVIDVLSRMIVGIGSCQQRCRVKSCCIS